jgi:hypothetical protein
MEIIWKACDGYEGNRPQGAYINEDELLDCESEEDVEELIEQTVENAFTQKVFYSYEDSETNKVLLPALAGVKSSKGPRD